MNTFTIHDDGVMKTSEIVAKLRAKFPVWIYNEHNIDKDFPPPAKPTVRHFRKLVEADQENGNKSANDLNQAEQITLRERLWMELAYFDETGTHLDVYNWTLCAGSRYSDGSVPDVYWHSGHRQLRVDWCSPDDASGSLRSRSAVSLETLPSNPSELECPHCHHKLTVEIKLEQGRAANTTHANAIAEERRAYSLLSPSTERGREDK